MPAPKAPPSGLTPSTRIGLKVDIDTDRGCAKGLPVLLKLLDQHHIRATFFLTLGPDNMGRSIWRVFTEPGFLKTVRRRGGASTYGWDILFKGFLWPGPILWKKHRDLYRSLAAAGHEFGVHAWDHHQWQRHGPTLPAEAVRKIWERMADAYVELFGKAPEIAAAPGWRASPAMFALADDLQLRFMSDIRGTEPFRPRMNGVSYATPQLPTTLPTIDELAGRGVPTDQLNAGLLAALRPGGYNCHTIHAEIEGLQYAQQFDALLQHFKTTGMPVVPLGTFADELRLPDLPVADVVDRALEGRSAMVSTQA